MTIKQALEREAEECKASSSNMNNTPQNREIFWLISIVLKGISERLTEQPAPPAPGYEDFIQQIRQAPKTWLPALLIEIAEVCAAKEVFQPEGMLSLLREKMKGRA